MSKKTTAWLIVAAFLVLIGSSLFVGVMMALDWNFGKLSTDKYETNSYEIDEPYINISIVTNTADILFLPAENGKTSVVCFEQENVKHTVKVTDNTLEIHLSDTRKWYEYIGFNFGSPNITIYLAQDDYSTLSVKADTGDVEISDSFRFTNMNVTLSTGDVTTCASVDEKLTIKTSTGHIRVKSVSANTVNLSVSTGKTLLTNVECKELESSGNTGDLFFNNVIVYEKLSVERSTGDIQFNKCDAGEIFIKTDTGDVEGSLLSDKVFIVQTDTGHVNVPQTTSGGKCEIITDTGDIHITLHPQS